MPVFTVKTTHKLTKKPINLAVSGKETQEEAEKHVAEVCPDIEVVKTKADEK